MPAFNPWEILGLTASATDDEVRQVWRAQAKELHPDFNPSKDAAHKFAEITKARDAILYRTSRVPHQSAAAAMRQEWAARAYAAASHTPQDMPLRSRNSALVFAGLSFIAGCGLFVGALMTYKAMDKYRWTSPDRVEERMTAYNPQRERLLDRIVYERAEMKARRQLGSQVSKPG